MTTRLEGLPDAAQPALEEVLDALLDLINQGDPATVRARKFNDDDDGWVLHVWRRADSSTIGACEVQVNFRASSLFTKVVSA